MPASGACSLKNPPDPNRVSTRNDQGTADCNRGTAVIVPETCVPFLSSMVTVSFTSISCKLSRSKQKKRSNVPSHNAQMTQQRTARMPAILPKNLRFQPVPVPTTSNDNGGSTVLLSFMVIEPTAGHNSLLSLGSQNGCRAQCSDP